MIERYRNDYSSLRRQFKVTFDLLFRMTESKGAEDTLEEAFMLRDEAFPHVSREIAVWFVAQKIEETKKIPRIFLYWGAANAPRKILESDLIRKSESGQIKTRSQVISCNLSSDMN